MAERKDKEHEEAINRAPNVVEKFIGKMINRAHKNLVKQKHGKGCGCNSCMNRSVKEANSWADVAAGGNENNPITHYRDWSDRGRIKTKPNPRYGRDDPPRKLGRPEE